MEKKDINIIIFMGMVEGPDYYSGRFIDYLDNKSISYYVVDAKNPSTYFSTKFDEFSSRPNVAMFTFNNVGLMLNESNGDNYWKKHGIPVFDYILDHPRNFYDSMLEPQSDLYIFTLDENHMNFIKRFYFKVKKVWFSPNGGTKMPDQIDYEQRDIDVIYMGNCNVGRMLYDAEDFEDGGLDFNNRSVKYLIEHPMSSTEEAVEYYFKSLNMDVTGDKLLDLNIKYAGCIESLVRRYYKLEGIKALDEAGVHVVVYGDGWYDRDYRFSDNITINSRIHVDTMMTMINRAKISLCYIPWFKKGCSEKNFDSMLNGAVCVSDRSEYLERNYTDGYNIVYFDLNNPAQMAADVKWLLENRTEAKRIAERGCDTAGKFDTWENRFDNVVSRICEVLDDRRGFNNVSVSIK